MAEKTRSEEVELNKVTKLGWHKVWQDSVKTIVLTVAVVAVLMATAQNPSTDDAVRGVAAGVVGSLLSRLTRSLV